MKEEQETISGRIIELCEHFEDFFWGIGYFGWQTSAVYGLYISYLTSWIDMVFFASVFLVSGWLNHLVFKNYINDPRPKGSTAFLAKEHIKINENGMPSGHAQLTSYSLMYSYLMSGQRLYESAALFFLTILQRFVYKNHTAAQLFAGTLVGIAFAYGTVYMLSAIKQKIAIKGVALKK
jgi:membrane-associated phospholipid phosphatase